jgi:hypothetical protein
MHFAAVEALPLSAPKHCLPWQPAAQQWMVGKRVKLLVLLLHCTAAAVCRTYWAVQLLLQQDV